MDVLTPFEIGYIMGVFVGEGCFTSSIQPHAAITMTDVVTLQHVQKLLGGTINGPYYYADGHKPRYHYTLRGAALARVSRLFLDHLPDSEKRTQFLDWYNLYKPWLERAERGLSSKNTSGVRGVYIRNGRYIASIRHKGVLRWHGSYDTLEEAEQAVVEARRKRNT